MAWRKLVAGIFVTAVTSVGTVAFAQAQGPPVTSGCYPDPSRPEVTLCVAVDDFGIPTTTVAPARVSRPLARTG